MFTRERVLTRKAFSGTLVLAGRKLVIQIVQTLATVILARLLFPEAFGAFAIIVFVVELFSLLPGQGLVAAVIQKKGKVSVFETNSIFWVLFSFSILVFVVLYSLSPIIADFISLSTAEEVGIVKLMSVAALFLNLKLVPLAILERQIKYQLIAIVEISETMLTVFVSVALAYLNFSILSLVLGYLCGRFFAVLLLYLFGPFKPRFVFDRNVIVQFSSFAFHYQTYSVVNSISGAIAPLYVGRVVGTAGVGYLSWAGGIGLIPWAFGELIGRVMFPVLSRVQNNKKLFRKLLVYALEASLALATPFAIIIFMFAEPITKLVFGQKWLPAVDALRFFVLLGYIATVTIIANSALSAMGRVRYVRNVSISGTFIFWILALVLVPHIGFAGHPLAWFLGLSFQIVLVFKISKIVKINYIGRVLWYLVLAVVVTGPYAILASSVANVFALFAVLGAAFASYGVILYFLKRELFHFYFREFLTFARGKQ